jgi:hypothetical protein
MAKGNADVVLELLVIGTLQRQLSDRLLRHAVRWVAEEKTTDTHVVPPAESGDGGTAGESAEEETAERDSGGAELSRAEVLNSVSGTANPSEELTTRTWLKRYHTNITAGVLATVLEGTRDLSAHPMDDVSLSSEEFRGALSLGRALNQLHDYDLGAAAETLSDVPEATFAQYPDVSRRVVEFLDAQRTDGGFGHWVDERRLYERQRGDDAGFDSELVDPLSETCQAALERVSASLSTAPSGGGR